MDVETGSHMGGEGKPDNGGMGKPRNDKPEGEKPELDVETMCADKGMTEEECAYIETCQDMKNLEKEEKKACKEFMDSVMGDEHAGKPSDGKDDKPHDKPSDLPEIDIERICAEMGLNEEECADLEACQDMESLNKEEKKECKEMMSFYFPFDYEHEEHHEEDSKKPGNHPELETI